MSSLQMPKVDSSILSKKDKIVSDIGRIINPKNVLSHPDELRPFETDGLTAYRQMPLIVVMPETVEEVSNILKYCNDNKVKVVPRGAGTGLSGGSLPLEDCVLMAMGKFNKILEIDYFTQKSLEILTNLSGELEGSLISCIDETKTASGSRLLKQRLIEPFFQINQIQDRHVLANWFLQPNIKIYEYQTLFENIPDFERSLSRISLLRGNPKDLLLISEGLLKVENILKSLIRIRKSECFAQEVFDAKRPAIIYTTKVIKMFFS